MAKCSTCQGTNRETKNMVCQTCGRNYGPPEAIHDWHRTDFPGGSWIDCTCGFSPKTAEQVQNHEDTTNGREDTVSLITNL